MKEKISSLPFISKAFQFEFEQRNRGRYENDRYPLSALEKLRLVVSTLVSKQDTHELLKMYSSFNYGTYLLNSVFPKYDNPEDYHSTALEVCLSEHPVQVMGWKEYEEKITEGVKSGLNRDYIRFGFDTQAERRGIDLEWSFHGEVPQNRSKVLPS